MYVTGPQRWKNTILFSYSMLDVSNWILFPEGICLALLIWDARRDRKLTFHHYIYLIPSAFYGAFYLAGVGTTIGMTPGSQRSKIVFVLGFWQVQILEMTITWFILFLYWDSFITQRTFSPLVLRSVFLATSLGLAAAIWIVLLRLPMDSLSPLRWIIFFGHALALAGYIDGLWLKFRYLSKTRPTAIFAHVVVPIILNTVSRGAILVPLWQKQELSSGQFSVSLLPSVQN